MFDYWENQWQIERTSNFVWPIVFFKALSVLLPHLIWSQHTVGYTKNKGPTSRGKEEGRGFWQLHLHRRVCSAAAERHSPSRPPSFQRTPVHCWMSSLALPFFLKQAGSHKATSSRSPAEHFFSSPSFKPSGKLQGTEHSVCMQQWKSQDSENLLPSLLPRVVRICGKGVRSREHGNLKRVQRSWNSSLSLHSGIVLNSCQSVN